MAKKYVAVHHVSLLGADGKPGRCVEPGAEIDEKEMSPEATIRLINQGSILPTNGVLPAKPSPADVSLAQELEKTKSDLTGALAKIKDLEGKLAEMNAANELMNKQLTTPSAPVETK